MLRITVTTHDAKPLPQPLAADFGVRGGTIGRAPESTLTLPDPDRVISRTHATIACRDGTYSLRDHGTAVPVVHNDRALGSGREVRLEAGDEIRIGKYVLKVERARPTEAAVAANELSVDATLPLPSDAAGARGAVPTHAMLSWTVDAVGDGVDAIRSVVIPAPMAGDDARACAVAAVEPARMHADSHASVQVHSAAGTPPVAAQDGSMAVAPREDAPADDPLLQAFLDGAQLRGLAVTGALTPERMREIGQMLRETVRGVLDLLAARAQTKRDVRADATVIVGRDNNPLKFAPSVEAAITHLVVPRGEGFMPPLRAVADAYASLHSHHQGFIAGMRAALGAVLARLDPRPLESGLEEESLADSLLPMSREAKLWDAFVRLHAEVTREAEADFHALVGREFLRAYQARVTGLGESGSGPPGS